MERIAEPPIIVYVDVDDTLVRTIGRKRIPIPEAIDHVKSLSADGAQLYCWSSGGGEYARSIAVELGISDLFIAFLPKPHVILDDQAISEWRRLVNIHPVQCGPESAATYRAMLSSGRRPGA